MPLREPLKAEADGATPSRSASSTFATALKSTCSAEFVWWKLGFRMTFPESAGIGRSAACASPAFFTAWRIVAATYMCGVVIGSIIDLYCEGSISTWPDYLTDWGIVVEATYLVMAALCSIYSRRFAVHGAPDPGAPPTRPAGFVVATWVLGNLSYVLAPFVVFTYWVFGYWAGHVQLIIWQVHGANLLFILVDCFFSARPYYLLHFWQPFCFGILYVVFTIIAYEADIITYGNDFFYSFLDWGQPGYTSYYVLMALFIGVPLTQCVMWLVWRAGKRLTGLDRFYAIAPAAEEERQTKAVPDDESGVDMGIDTQSYRSSNAGTPRLTPARQIGQA